MTSSNRRYATADAVRVALEARLADRARASNVDVVRLRRLAALERFLARLYQSPSKFAWLLKGGLALELRFPGRARSTKDADLGVPLDVAPALGDDRAIRAVEEALIQAAAVHIEDHFVFSVEPPAAGSSSPIDGARDFVVQADLAGRVFDRFHLDVGVGDAVVTAPDWITFEPYLEFLGLPPTRVAVFPVSAQIAEKLHAYTRPRGPDRQNTRVKDLVDLALLIERAAPEVSSVAHAVRATFDRRGTHPVPRELPDPPRSWELPYARLAAEADIKARPLSDGIGLVRSFWARLPL